MARPRVVLTSVLPGADGVSGPGPPPALARVADCEVWQGDGPMPAGELRRSAADSEGILCLLTDAIDRRLIDACPSLRVISSCSVGVDHVDLAAAAARGIPVGHTPGVLTETTADLAFALLLSAARRVVEGDRFVRRGSWTPARRWRPDMLLGPDVHGATLGVIGLGAIGQAVARRASGFGMRVLGWTRSGRQVPGVEPAALDRLLAESDFVTLHVAATAETRDLLDAAALSTLKRGAVVVNTARGGIVDEEALAEALRSGQVAAAGLDVFEGEPLSADSPLLELQNVVLTPHIGSASVRTRVRMAELAVENLLAGLAGEPLVHCANAEALR